HGATVGRSADDPSFEYACAYAWHSENLETVAGALINAPFTSAMSPRRVREETRIWRQRIALAAALEQQPRLHWPTTGPDTAYRFVPLRTARDFIAESRSMKNCLDRYGGPLETGRIVLISVRRDGRPVANLELSLQPGDSAQVTISQLKGPANRIAGRHVWRAARSWVAHHADRAQTARALTALAKPHRRAASRALVLDALWHPYFAFLGSERAATFDLSMRRSNKSEQGRRRMLTLRTPGNRTP
ncbi:MAG: hypothetical protein AAGG99_08110, partial [Pseudomonadota bacterium]